MVNKVWNSDSLIGACVLTARNSLSPSPNPRRPNPVLLLPHPPKLLPTHLLPLRPLHNLHLIRLLSPPHLLLSALWMLELVLKLRSLPALLWDPSAPRQSQTWRPWASKEARLKRPCALLSTTLTVLSSIFLMFVLDFPGCRERRLLTWFILGHSRQYPTRAAAARGCSCGPCFTTSSTRRFRPGCL